MFNLRSVFAFWAFVALFLGSAGRAQAQATGGVSVTLAPTVIRDHQQKSGTIPVTQINYNDCLTEDFATFTVNLGVGYNNYSLEVWAGDACDTKTNRVGGTATCWKVASGQPNSIVYSQKVTIRDMLSGRTGGTAPVVDPGTGGTGGGGGTGGTDTPVGDMDAGIDIDAGDVVGSAGTDSSGGGSTGSGSNVPSGAPSECIAQSDATAPQSLTLFFMLVDGGSNSVGTASWKATYKLTSSAPPDTVTADTGENIAVVHWSYTTSNQDQYVNGYQFFCDPAPGDPSVMAEPGIIPICQDTKILVPGTRPADKYKCGTADRAATRGNATGLVNNVAYHVAVATTDTYLNTGNISPATCAVPQPVTGFFEAYRGAGGEGGGGFCSFSRHRRPALLFTVFGLALCLVLRRRRAT
jgi:hypothetical protein